MNEKNNIKIILCTPVQKFLCLRQAPPISLMYTASVAYKLGYDISIIDNFITRESEEEFFKRVKSAKAQIWGLTCHVENRFHAFKTAKIIKKASPESLVILGGIFASICYKEIMEDINAIDIIVIGDGEYKLVEIAKKFKNKDFKNISNICYRKDGLIVYNHFSTPISNLDEIPMLPINLIEWEKYGNMLNDKRIPIEEYPLKFRKLPAAHLMFSRGCPFQCIFCSSKKQGYGGYRIQSPSKAVDQVEKFYDKGFRTFIFWDDHLLLKPGWFDSFYKEIKERFHGKIYFKMSSRIDALDEKKIKKMKELGCIRLTIGIEYGNNRMLKVIKKGTTTRMIRKIIEILNKHHIYTCGGMLTNFPEETKQDIEDSLLFFYSLEDKYYIFSKTPNPVQIHPGTQLDIEYLQKKNPTFRWTQPYYKKSNLYLRASPFTPLFFRFDNVELLDILINIYMKKNLFPSFITTLFHIFVPNKVDKIYLKFFDRFLLKLIVSKLTIKNIFLNPHFIFGLLGYLYKRYLIKKDFKLRKHKYYNQSNI